MKQATHPANLALRFALELAALYGLGFWGWSTHLGFARFAWTTALVFGAALLWGIFNVPGDPSRSGGAPVPVTGVLRLLLELAFFAAGSWAFITAGRSVWGWALAAFTLLHYGLWHDRVRWLLRH